MDWVKLDTQSSTVDPLKSIRARRSSTIKNDFLLSREVHHLCAALMYGMTPSVFYREFDINQFNVLERDCFICIYAERHPRNINSQNNSFQHP